jgi:hypothetical protein
MHKTKEVVLYKTLIQDQQDRAVAIKYIKRMNEELAKAQRRLEEQRGQLPKMKATQEETRRSLGAAGAIAGVASTDSELPRGVAAEEKALDEMEKKAEILPKAIEVMKSSP